MSDDEVCGCEQAERLKLEVLRLGTMAKVADANLALAMEREKAALAELVQRDEALDRIVALLLRAAPLVAYCNPPMGREVEAAAQARAATARFACAKCGAGFYMLENLEAHQRNCVGPSQAV